VDHADGIAIGVKQKLRECYKRGWWTRMWKRNRRSATWRKRERDRGADDGRHDPCADPIDNARERNLKDAAEERR
jgi:hypothetical protein